MPITNMPEAQAAYAQAMASLAAAHTQLNLLSQATPVNWMAYQAALDVCNAVQKTAQTALAVFEATILDTPAVALLRTKLITVTATMKSRTDALTSAAATLNNLTAAAGVATGVLTTIADDI